MLEVGWSELLVIAIILIVVVGPKDLPAMMRTFGRVMGRVRTMANEFRGQFDEAMREAELDDVRKGLDEVKKYNPSNSIRDAINPIRQMGQDIKSDLQKASSVSTTKSTPVDEGTPLDELMADPVIDPEPATTAADPAKSAPQTVAATDAKPAQATATAAAASAATTTAAAPVAASTVSAPAVSAKAKPAARKPAKAKTAAASEAADYPPPAAKVVKRKAAEKHVEHDVKVAAADAKPKPAARKAAPKAKTEPAADITVEAAAAKPKPAPKKKTTKTGDA